MKHLIIRLLTCASLFLLPLAQAQDNQLTLLVYGDSLSAGYGMDEDQSWVELLTLRLADQEYSIRVINGSISGETSTGGLERLPAMLESYSPEVMILELGGNDGLRGLPLVLLKENLRKMILLAEDSGARVLLAGIQIPPNYGSRYTVPFTDLFINLAEEENLEFIPFLIEGIPQQPELMQNDGIHPKAEAQIMVLDNVWPYLKPMLDSASDRK